MGHRLSLLVGRYAVGFGITLLLVVNAAVFGLVAGAILYLAGMLLGWPDSAILRFFAFSAVLWLPLSVGVIMPTILRNFGRLIDERRAV